jgi:carbonic anhydrase
MISKKTSRSNTMKHPYSIVRTLTALLCILGFVNTGSGAEPSGVSAAEALQRLEQGNARFVSGRLTSMTPAEIDASRTNVAQGQKPFAIVVACSDSRVGPEVIFDQKVGDIFVVRTAGEVIDPFELGTIEYAVAHLGPSLIMVVGHERCGAVAAAVAGAKEPGHIAAVLKAIQPAVRQTKGEPGDAVHNAVCAQALNVAAQLQNAEPILKEAVQSGKLTIIAALYDLDTGKVSLLSAAQR